MFQTSINEYYTYNIDDGTQTETSLGSNKGVFILVNFFPFESIALGFLKWEANKKWKFQLQIQSGANKIGETNGLFSGRFIEPVYEGGQQMLNKVVSVVSMPNDLEVTTKMTNVTGKMLSKTIKIGKIEQAHITTCNEGFIKVFYNDFAVRCISRCRGLQHFEADISVESTCQFRHCSSDQFIPINTNVCAYTNQTRDLYLDPNSQDYFAECDKFKIFLRKDRTVSIYVCWDSCLSIIPFYEPSGTGQICSSTLPECIYECTNQGYRCVDTCDGVQAEETITSATDSVTRFVCAREITEYGNQFFEGTQCTKGCPNSQLMRYQVETENIIEYFCTDKCPDHSPFEVPFNNHSTEQIFCYSSCAGEYTKARIDTTTSTIRKICTDTIPSNLSYFAIETALQETELRVYSDKCYAPNEFIVAEGSAFQCLPDCPDGKKFVHALPNYPECKAKCDNDKFNGTKDGDRIRCANVRPTDKAFYTVYTTHHLYDDECNDSDKFYETDSDWKKCVFTCDSSLEFRLKDGNYHKCVPSCSDYANEESFGLECVSSCPNGKQHIKQITGAKECLTECGTGYDYVYPDGNYSMCASACPLPNHKVVQQVGNDMLCLGECPDDYPYTLTTTNHVECLTECPNTNDYTTKKTYGLECSAICPFGYNVVQQVEDYLQCLTKCPDNYLYTLTTTDHVECLTQCPQGYNYITDTTYGLDCSTGCPNGYDYQLKLEHYHQCFQECPDTDKYYTYLTSFNICEKDCFNPAVYFTEEDNGFKCTSECPSDRNKIEIDTRQCLAECRIQYPFEAGDGNCYRYCPPQFPFQNGIKCATKCPLNSLIEPRDYDYASTSSQAILAGKCVLSCDDYLMNDTVCLNSCPIDRYTTPDKKCVEDCSTTQTPFSTPNMTCVSDCSFYNFEVEDNSCAFSCTLNKYFPPNNEIAKCLTKCPLEAPFLSGDTCTTGCPEGEFLLNMQECVSTCPELYQGIFCVSACNDPKTVAFATEIGKPIPSQPYILSTKVCYHNCIEPEFKIINEITLECIPKCPHKCSELGCEHEDLVFMEEEKICRVDCTNPSFPFRIKGALPECRSVCPEDLPFNIKGQFDCISSCPASYLISITCLSTDCFDKKYECVEECPEDNSFLQMQENRLYCVNECFKWFKPDENNICELNCDSSLGLVEDLTKTGCTNCFKDLEKFYFNDNCVSACPLATRPDSFGVCYPCSYYDEWTYYGAFCHSDDSLCGELDVKDNIAKLCLKCDYSKGMMNVYEEGVITCQSTDCSGGAIDTDNNIRICYFCGKQFYYRNECHDVCPNNTEYDFSSRRCISRCSDFCSCCKGSDCQNRICNCPGQGLKTRCDVNFTLSNPSDLTTLLNPQLVNKTAQTNLIRSIYDFIALKEQSRLLLETATLKRNLKNFIMFFKENPSESWFTAIDAYLFLLFNENPPSTLQIFREIDDLLDNYMQSGTFREIKFKGLFLDLEIGYSVESAEGLSLDSCVSKLKKAKNLPETYKLAFRKTNLNLILIESLGIELEISTNPQEILKIFSGSSLLNIGNSCSGGDVDVEKEAQVSVEEGREAQKFKSTGLNVFDSEAPAFIDKCVPMSIDGKDLTLTERREQILKSPKEVCAEPADQICSATVEPITGAVKCTCKGLRNRKKPLKASISVPSNNFVLVTCLQTFKQADYLKNPGLIVILLPFLLFFLVGVKLQSSLYRCLEKENKHILIKNEYKCLDKDKMHIPTYFEEIDKFEETVIKSLIAGKLKEENLMESVKKGLPTLKDLNSLTSSEKLTLDYRSNWQYFKDSMLTSHRIVNAFCFYSFTSPQIFRLLCLITQINLNTFLSAFFIDDKMVQEANEQGTPSILDSFGSNIYKTLCAVGIVRIVMTTLKNLSFFSETQVDKLKRRLESYKGNKTFVSLSHFMANNSVKTSLFVIVVVLVNLFCWYFVVIYAEIFVNTRGIWMNGIIAGWIVDFGVVDTLFPILAVACRTMKTNTVAGKTFLLLDKLIQMKAPIKLK